MSVSYYTRVLRDVNSESHQKMVRAVEALEAAGVDDLPVEMAKYFNSKSVDDVTCDTDETLEIATIWVEEFVSKDPPPYVVRIKDRDRLTTTLRIDVRELPDDAAFVDVVISA